MDQAEAAVAMTRAAALGAGFAGAGVADTPANRDLWVKVCADIDAMPAGVAPAIPWDYAGDEAAPAGTVTRGAHSAPGGGWKAALHPRGRGGEFAGKGGGTPGAHAEVASEAEMERLAGQVAALAKILDAQTTGLPAEQKKAMHDVATAIAAEHAAFTASEARARAEDVAAERKAKRDKMIRTVLALIACAVLLVVTAGLAAGPIAAAVAGTAPMIVAEGVNFAKELR